MAAGDRLLDPSGNKILQADGDAHKMDGAGDECCCGCDPDSCPDAETPSASPCDACGSGDKTPDELTATFTASWCACRHYVSGGNTFSYKVVGTLSSYTLHWSNLGGEGCVWRNDNTLSTMAADAGFTVTSYNGGTCSGGGTDLTANFGFEVKLQRHPTTWSLFARFFHTTLSLWIYIFLGSVDDDAACCCTGSNTIPNNDEDCATEGDAPTLGLSLANGGSALIEEP